MRTTTLITTLIATLIHQAPPALASCFMVVWMSSQYKSVLYPEKIKK